MVDFQVSEESIATLCQQANVSIAFEYDRVLELTVKDNGLGGFVLTERQLDVSKTKDYDKIGDEGPSSWTARFDVTRWGFIVARAKGQRIGGAVIAFDTVGLDMLERRRDLAVLWDIRIDSDFRGHGVGSSLFQAAENWSVTRKCSQLKIETQNTNLAACRFYAAQGCTLGAVNRMAYPNLPNEVQMIWYKSLVSDMTV